MYVHCSVVVSGETSQPNPRVVPALEDNNAAHTGRCAGSGCTSILTLPAATNASDNELTTTAAPLELRSTIIKGRWADVDSDDSD
jgi:hypothetical protein